MAGYAVHRGTEHLERVLEVSQVNEDGAGRGSSWSVQGRLLPRKQEVKCHQGQNIRILCAWRPCLYLESPREPCSNIN